MSWLCYRVQSKLSSCLQCFQQGWGYSPKRHSSQEGSVHSYWERSHRGFDGSTICSNCPNLQLRTGRKGEGKGLLTGFKPLRDQQAHSFPLTGIKNNNWKSFSFAHTNPILKNMAEQQNRFSIHKTEAIKKRSNLKDGGKSKNRAEKFGSPPQCSSAHFHPEESMS